MADHSEDLESIETTYRLVKGSLISQQNLCQHSKWNNKPRQQDFNSMDDIKPTRTILKRPAPIDNSKNV